MGYCKLAKKTQKRTPINFYSNSDFVYCHKKLKKHLQFTLIIYNNKGRGICNLIASRGEPRIFEEKEAYNHNHICLEEKYFQVVAKEEHQVFILNLSWFWQFFLIKT